MQIWFLKMKVAIKVAEAILNAQVRYLQVFVLLPVSMRYWYYLNHLG